MIIVSISCQNQSKFGFTPDQWLWMKYRPVLIGGENMKKNIFMKLRCKSDIDWKVANITWK